MGISLHKIEFGELRTGFPAHFVEDHIARFAAEFLHAKEDQHYGIPARIGVLIAHDFLACRAENAQFLLQFPRQRLFGRFTGLHLASREFPFQRVRLLGLSAADQQPPLAFNDPRHHLNHANIGA